MNYCKDDKEVEVREKLARLGFSLPERVYNPLQEAITSITGKPYRGQQPLFKQSRFTHLVTALLSLLIGAFFSGAIAQSSPLLLPLLPLPYLFAVGGARKLQTGIMHQLIHYNFCGNKAGDRLLGEIISTILLIPGFDSYQKDHIKDHHSTKTFATANDPDMKFLLQLGFRPGMPKEFYWRLLFKTLFSPRFHWLFLRARLIANFVTAPLYRCLMAVIWTGIVLLGVAITNAWFAFFAAWLFPLTVLYHIAALFQFVSEHRWLLTEVCCNEKELVAS